MEYDIMVSWADVAPVLVIYTMALFWAFGNLYRVVKS